MLDRDMMELALCWLVMVDTYLRPTELIQIFASQVIAPVAQKGMEKVVIALNPAGSGFVSKTGEFNESLQILRPWLGSALLRYSRTRTPAATTRLWGFNLLQMRQVLHRAAKSLGLEKLNIVPYTARHTGASLDRLEDNLSLAEVQRRGRWKAEASVRRYEKRALAQEVAHLLPPRLLQYCQETAARLPSRLDGLWQPGGRRAR